jgi:hypothetical protein
MLLVYPAGTFNARQSFRRLGSEARDPHCGFLQVACSQRFDKDRFGKIGVALYAWARLDDPERAKLRDHPHHYVGNDRTIYGSQPWRAMIEGCDARLTGEGGVDDLLIVLFGQN